MTDDARIAVGLPTHPKTRKLIRRLGPGAGWSLVCLFLWAAQSRHDGNLAGLSDEDIEIAADWSGDPGVLVACLVAVRFLDGSEGARTIHDWAEHNPWAAAKGERIASAKAAASVRWACDPHATRMRPACDADAPITKPQCPPPTPYLHQERKQKPVAPPSAPPTKGQRLPAGWEPPLALRQWAADQFPAVDFPAELEAFRDYWRAKPGANGRKLDWDATLRNWIRRAKPAQRAGPGKPKTVAAYDAIGATIHALTSPALVHDENRFRDSLADPDGA